MPYTIRRNGPPVGLLFSGIVHLKFFSLSIVVIGVAMGSYSIWGLVNYPQKCWSQHQFHCHHHHHHYYHYHIIVVIMITIWPKNAEMKSQNFSNNKRKRLTEISLSQKVYVLIGSGVYRAPATAAAAAIVACCSYSCSQCSIIRFLGGGRLLCLSITCNTPQLPEPACKSATQPVSETRLEPKLSAVVVIY